MRLPSWSEYAPRLCALVARAPATFADAVFVRQSRDNVACCLVRCLFWAVAMLASMAQGRIALWLFGMAVQSVILMDEQARRRAGIAR